MTSIAERVAAIFAGSDPRVPAIALLLIRAGYTSPPAADEIAKLLEREDPVIRLNPEQAAILREQVGKAVEGLNAIT